MIKAQTSQLSITMFQNMSEAYQLPDFLEFVFLLTAFFACKFSQLSPRKFYTLFLPHTFKLYNRFLCIST